MAGGGRREAGQVPGSRPGGSSIYQSEDNAGRGPVRGEGEQADGRELIIRSRERGRGRGRPEKEGTQTEGIYRG